MKIIHLNRLAAIIEIVDAIVTVLFSVIFVSHGYIDSFELLG